MTGTGLVGDIRMGVRIARADVIDLLRRNDSRRQRVIYALLFLLMLPTAILFIRQSYSLGLQTQDGVAFPVVAGARNLLLPMMFMFAVLGGLGAAQSLSRDAVRPLLLTSAPTRAIVVGQALYLLVTWLAPLAFVLVPLLSYSAGARAPLFPIAVVVFMLPVLLLTLLVGLTLAYLLWLGIERLGLPEAVRKLVTASISLVVFIVALSVGFLSGRVTTDSTDLFPTGDPITPLGWYADLLFVGSPVAEPLSLQTMGAALIVILAIPLVFSLQVRIAPAFWYATPTETDETDDERRESNTVPDFEATPSELIGRKNGITARSGTLRAALAYVRTAVRRPDQYVYLFYYIFPVLALLVPLGIEAPQYLLPAIGVSLVVLGVWLAGALFCLNPLGTEGAMLSQLVLAQTPASNFVHARLLAGTTLGLVLSLSGVALYAVTGPFVTPAVLGTGTALGVGVVTASAGFALGIGSALPKFETIEVFDSVETLAPSVIAALVHAAVALVFLGTAVATTALVAVPDSPLSTPQRVGLMILVVSVLVATTDGSRRYAVARLGQYGEARTTVDRPFSVYAGFMLSLLAVVLGQLSGLTVAILVGLDRPELLLLPLLFVFEYLGYVLVTVGFLYATRRGYAYIDLSWPTPRELGIIAGGVAISLAVWATGLMVISGLGLPVADHALFSAEDADPRLLLALIPLLLFINGPVEELLYRNVIQKYLQEWFSATPAILCASAIFTLAHIPAYLTAELSAVVVTLGLLFCLSCLWGGIYARTNSLVVISAIHGLYNAILVGMAYLWLVS